jgi:hypothetical protein
VIHINKAIASLGRANNAIHFIKYRCAFLIFATIVHELSHQKLRRDKVRNSPKSQFPEDWMVRLKLVSGSKSAFLVASFILLGPGNLDAGLFLKRKLSSGRVTTNRIDDTWIRNTVFIATVTLSC